MGTSVFKFDGMIADVWCTDRDLVVKLTDGSTRAVPLWWYPRLFNATSAQRRNLEIQGIGIHWPEIDEDISLKGIMEGNKAPGAKEPAIA